MTVNRERLGLVQAAGAECAGDGRRDAPAHRTRRHHLHEHQERENQRDTGERVGAEHADEVRLDKPDRSLHDHDEHVRGRELEQRRRDRRLQQKTRALIHAAARSVVGYTWAKPPSTNNSAPVM